MSHQVSENIQKSIEIAKLTLRSNYTDAGIVAGKDHFSDVWARDSLFASFGSIALGDTEVVKKI